MHINKLGISLSGTRDFALGAAAAAFACVGFAGAPTAQTVELKLSHYVPPNFILYRPNTGGGMQDWIDSIHKASDGSIKITVFPAQQLGKAQDHYNMARSGIAEITMAAPGYLPGQFPIIGLSEVPFMMPDAGKGSAALWAWYRKYADIEMKEVKVLNAYVMESVVLHTRDKVVRLPSDMKGMRLRPSTGMLGNFFELLGASAAQVPVTEARDLVERGIVDGLTLQWGSTVAFGISKSVNRHLDMKIATGPIATVMNRKAYDAMSDAQKKVIDDHSTPYWAQRIITPWYMWDIAGRHDIMNAPGSEVHTPTAQEIAAWKAAAAPLLDQWKESVKKRHSDLNPDAVLAEFHAIQQKSDGVTWAVYN